MQFGLEQYDCARFRTSWICRMSTPSGTLEMIPGMSKNSKSGIRGPFTWTQTQFSEKVRGGSSGLPKPGSFRRLGCRIIRCASRNALSILAGSVVPDWNGHSSTWGSSWFVASLVKRRVMLTADSGSFWSRNSIGHLFKFGNFSHSCAKKLTSVDTLCMSPSLEGAWAKDETI